MNGIKIKGNKATLLVRNKTNIGSLERRLNKETKACQTKVRRDKTVSTKVLRKSNINHLFLNFPINTRAIPNVAVNMSICSKGVSITNFV